MSPYGRERVEAPPATELATDTPLAGLLAQPVRASSVALPEPMAPKLRWVVCGECGAESCWLSHWVDERGARVRT